MKTFLSFRGAAGVLAFALGVSAQAVTTVGAYAPNPNAISIVDASSNGAASGISLTAFQTLASSAFTADTGGVVDFEAATGWTTANVASFDVNYGASGANLLTVTRTDGGLMLNTNSNNGVNVVSGVSYLGFNATNAVFSFSKGLSAFGLTMVPRGADRTTSLTFLLDDASTLVTSTESVVSANTNAKFFGATAPVGRTIVGVTFGEVPGQFVRYDDLGFVVAQTVPEPSTVAALALGGLVLLRRRKA